MTDGSSGQRADAVPSGTSGATPVPGKLRAARPLKVAKPLEPTTPQAGAPAPSAAASVLPVGHSVQPGAAAAPQPVVTPAKRTSPLQPTPLSGGLARPLTLEEARAAGIVVPALTPAAQTKPKEPDAETEAEAAAKREKEYWKQALSSWGISMLVNTSILLILALITTSVAIFKPDIVMTVAERDPVEQIEEVTIEPTPVIPEAPQMQEQTNVAEVEDLLALKNEQVDHAEPTPERTITEAPLNTPGLETAFLDPLAKLPFGGGPKGSGNAHGTGLGGEGSILGGRAERRKQAALDEGSNPKSEPIEPVVEVAMNWLARHQLPDGGWAFEHRVGECRGRCPNPGKRLDARVAATGLALLPFLGAGHTHLEGQYRHTVAAGLKFLMAKQTLPGGLVEKGGQMYGHGIATIALCEAFGVIAQRPAPPPPVVDYNGKRADGSEMTDEEKKKLKRLQQLDNALRIRNATLGDAARRAAAFINGAQHAEGGWRYYPGQAGDMSVVGWQVMGLASAQHAGFGFDKNVRAKALGFLRLCGGDMQGDEAYGRICTRFAYTPPTVGERPNITQATTAIGLLSMIYMGVNPQHPGMKVAVKRLSEQGPALGDMYYTYYANQIMYQHGGVEWDEWKKKLEAQLLAKQDKEGHLEGSWFLPGDHGSTEGGRVYCTVMALLCLEEHYRHMRLFDHAPPNVKNPPAAGNGAKPADNAEGKDAQPANPDAKAADKPPAEGIVIPGAGTGLQPKLPPAKAATPPPPEKPPVAGSKPGAGSGPTKKAPAVEEDDFPTE